MRAFHVVLIEFLLEGLQEVGHELNVLQENPVTFLVSQLKLAKGNNVLTITKSDWVELLLGVNSILSGEGLNINNGVGTGRKDEVDWGS